MADWRWSSLYLVRQTYFEKSRYTYIDLGQLAISDAGADISRATYDATFTSLHHALAKGHMEVARLLVEKGADVNVLNEGGCYGSSLHYSVYKDDLEFTK